MKKLFALLLAAVMLLSLVACDTEKPVETKPQETQGNNKPVETKPVETEPAPPVTVKWLTIVEEPEDADDVLAHINELLLERYNLQLEVEWIGTGEYNDRTALAANAGEDYDIVYTTYSWLNKFHENVAKEAFYDISGILDEHGAAIKEQLVPAIWDVAKVGDAIYAIPNQQASGTGLAFYVQKELADKYGLDYSKPMWKGGEDIEWFLKEIKENEPDLWPIQLPQGCIPQDWDGLAASGLIGYKLSDDPADGIEVLWKTSDSSWPILNRWFNEGYIHPEFHVDPGTINTLKANNQFAVFTGNCIIDGAKTITDQQGGLEYVQIRYTNPLLGPASGSDTMLAINANSKDPVAALRMINAFWEDEEIFNTFMFGLEGVHYNKIDENHVELIEGSNYNLTGYDWAHGNQFNRWLMPGEYENKWQETYDTNASADVSPIRGFTVDLTEFQVEITQINAVRGEYLYAYLEDNYEELDAKYKQKLIDAGIEKVVAGIQAQLDAFLAGK